MGKVASHITDTIAREFLGEPDGAWIPVDYPLFERGVLDWSDVHRLAGLIEREFSLELPDEWIAPASLDCARTIEALVHRLRATGIPASREESGLYAVPPLHAA